MTPGKGSIATLVELRRIAPHAKVIAVSGDSTYVVSQTVEDDVLEHAQAPGADRVLRKPLDPVEPLKDCIPKPFELSYVGDVVAAAVTVRP